MNVRKNKKFYEILAFMYAKVKEVERYEGAIGLNNNIFPFNKVGFCLPDNEVFLLKHGSGYLYVFACERGILFKKRCRCLNRFANFLARFFGYDFAGALKTCVELGAVKEEEVYLCVSNCRMNELNWRGDYYYSDEDRKRYTIDHLNNCPAAARYSLTKNGIDEITDYLNKEALKPSIFARVINHHFVSQLIAILALLVTILAQWDTLSVWVKGVPDLFKKINFIF